MNEEKFSIGIDVSKITLDIGIVSSSKKNHKKIKNELSGYTEILLLCVGLITNAPLKFQRKEKIKQQKIL